METLKPSEIANKSFFFLLKHDDILSACHQSSSIFDATLKYVR